ncbi:glycosyltransferase family 2 protein [Caproiciproducens galactitolivorans]|uniref:Glycosyltransferase n=1 Tax=Caproiciproducens galactitolivorans TaxID=642589 RepID=A0ABT4BQZ8_9FIRM|nr:glycosyltransferase [Caproiciproducens galactitolivorans]MCY1713332.1 glycosyltransferase [Caproiciproducens galactitolivorans]
MAANGTAPKISIIIPVYNVEKYVGKCLSSLISQTFTDFEIIAVNDGSKDDSLSILLHFQEKYDNITVLNQKNCGMSPARNAGLEIARGEYICFVDSDDYVAPTYLEELYNACVETESDIACCYYYFHFVENDFLFEYPFRCRGVFDRGEAMNKLLRDVQIQSLMWNKIYKHSLFTDYDIKFPTMCFEDMAIANKIFAHADRVTVIDRPLYYYNQHPASTLATMNADKINDFIRAIAMVRISLERNGLYEKYKKSYLALTRKTCGCCYLYVLKLHNEKKCMRGCMTNMKRVSRAIKHYSADEFSPTTMFSELPDVVDAPEKLEKDYSTR